jgi:hypothetical protein
MDRNIMDKARCMLSDSGLEKEFWSEAVMSATYTINRCPTLALKNAISAELWYGRKQNIGKLKVFGCIAHLHIPKELRKGKLDTHSKACIMLGYCANGYRLWDIKTNRLVSGRDIIFDEKRTIKSLKKNEFYSTSDQEEGKNEDIEVQSETLQGIGKELHTETQETLEPMQLPRSHNNDTQELGRGKRKKTKPQYLEDYVEDIDTDDLVAYALMAEEYVSEVPAT